MLSRNVNYFCQGCCGGLSISLSRSNLLLRVAWDRSESVGCLQLGLSDCDVIPSAPTIRVLFLPNFVRLIQQADCISGPYPHFMASCPSRLNHLWSSRKKNSQDIRIVSDRQHTTILTLFVIISSITNVADVPYYLWGCSRDMQRQISCVG